MLIPSLACQAKCSYCFGPNRGPIMSTEAFTAAVEWIAEYFPIEETIEITLHGGRTTSGRKKWYRQNLPILNQRFEHRLKLAIQSNLWLLDDDFSGLFREYGVSVGTSFDGPEHLNDAQRGKGYFARTMAGIEIARRSGLQPGVICTFTSTDGCMDVSPFEQLSHTSQMQSRDGDLFSFCILSHATRLRAPF